MNFFTKLLNFFPYMLYTIKDDEFWAEGGEGFSYAFMKDFIQGLDKILLPFMFALATIFAIYAIVLGVNYARAENQTDAKKKLIGAISSVVVIVALTIVFKFFLLPNMGAIFSFLTDTFRTK